MAAIPYCMGLLLLISACRQVETTPLDNARAFLWSQQAKDGGWHSNTHAILRDGESLTPFILVALLHPEDQRRQHAAPAKRALEFIRRNVLEKISGDSIPLILDYPNYTAAYALQALLSYGEPSDSIMVHDLTNYLIDQQFGTHRGIGPDHPAYGGWGFGETNLRHGSTGHVDLSHTRRVLEALRLVLPEDHAVFIHARRFLAQVQNFDSIDSAALTHLDGGFFASAVTTETNKSLSVNGHTAWESYATATCDGLLALDAAGVTDDDPRVIAARKWLGTHSELMYPQGIPHDDPLQWHRVMKYYHLAVRSETARITGEPWPSEAVLKLLSAEQLPDGSFVNPVGGPNKEDDPLLATALAVIAMQ